MKNEIVSFFKSKIGIVTVVCVTLAIILIVAGSGSRTQKTEKRANTDFEEEIEARLEKLIMEIDGVNKVKVMVTTDCGVESVYSENKDVNEGSTKIEYGSNSLLLKELCPKIRGVAVVCSGGEDQKVQNKIVNLIKSVLDISSNHIYVGT